jgi:hypothetical protein
LVWREIGGPSPGRWGGSTPDGRQVGHVGEVVSDGGERRYWHAWHQDGTVMGVDLGEFATAEEAMAAVDESIATRGLEA